MTLLPSFPTCSNSTLSNSSTSSNRGGRFLGQAGENSGEGGVIEEPAAFFSCPRGEGTPGHAGEGRSEVESTEVGEGWGWDQMEDDWVGWGDEDL